MIASTSTNQKLSHKEILQELEAILIGRWWTDLANASALLNQHFRDINWVGFYLLDSKNSENLILGPFQGLPACTEIRFGKGVCGTAAATGKSQLVPDVDAFPGHIVCDSRSKSEVVIPMIQNNQLIGVLDVDSASLNRFSNDDLVFFESVVKIILSKNAQTFKI